MIKGHCIVEKGIHNTSIRFDNLIKSDIRIESVIYFPQ
jgi:hypothetical protein